MKLALSALALVVVAYVVLNVAVIAFAPVLWHVDVEVDVVDAGGGGAPAGTRVELQSRAGGSLGQVQALEPGRTVVLDLVHQQQPTWMWPRFGALALDEKVRATTEDGRVQTVDLTPVPLTRAEGRHHAKVVIHLPAR